MLTAVSSLRPDMTDDVVHFVRARDRDGAYDILERILDERTLRGGTGMIKGLHRCVCFTEAPPAFFSRHFGRTRKDGTSFQPFGIQVPKTHLFERGGRMVKYQPDSDYHKLPPDEQHLHVRHELGGNNPIDFTWEREWRIKTDAFELDPKLVKVVVHPAYEKLLRLWHDHEQWVHSQLMYDAYGCGFDPEPFAWEVTPLHYEDRGYGNHK